MKVLELITSPKGTLLANIGNGKYVAKANTMELAICSKVKEGYKVEKCVMVGFMMREHKDFIDAVNCLTEKEIRTSK